MNVRGLALFYLDHTLIPMDSDHSWDEFTMASGWSTLKNSNASTTPFTPNTKTDSLRHARARESMLAAVREMIAGIDKMAGHERADSISERIAMLVPPDA